uniref:NADH-ubiquinone oxidoreductase chain 2 n=1 Tax=Colaspidea globosa TaxID=1425613 RepID=A0A3G1GP09_9CUCU|nr:NADH dehydrogenase subunit 2 [Colaspidea globosa]
MFFLMMAAGTLIAISSYSWLSMWMGLEVNLLSIIPLLKDLNNKFPTESALKYFVVQSMASTMFLFSMILNMEMFEQINNFYNNIIMIIFWSSILIKLGAAPFYAWFPEVLEGLSWLNCLLMLTWQKIAPMAILMQNFKLSTFLIIVIVLSSLIGSMLGLNQISLRKIMAYSSINHIAWMISSMMSSKMIWTFYFMIYAIISIIIVITFNTTKTFFLHQMNMFKTHKLLNIIVNLNFLSLGGLPPPSSIFPKMIDN